ncbi:DUF1109 domain-containing protein [Kaistia dalseonensis]|uniref:DUF1109 family protein n=1 Tax=Kaistia dalseonensis TaxID=410840 RepID=A0ABU0H9V8_9HYPH|nr:DUF1109 domain-containing protein [Kaistia dalseonensis]MCX5496477.1 DUF1109 domain-containing protein [Kaistia dalseonensis]MDQ0439099.1 hypothetical protein [Kaistia dalseonensis]
MKTEDLIRGLSADSSRRPGLGAGLALALGPGLLGSMLLFTLLLRLRPDLAEILAEPRLILKFAVTLTLAAAASALVLRLSRPGADPRPGLAALLVPLAILAIGVGGEMAATPESSWMTGLIGHNARFCVALIPLISAPLLGAALLALKRGAPTRPALAGAAAGLVAGGIGAALYALHCTDDSPLFVLTWYTLGIAIVTAAGALIGRRLLAW